jgi:two-component system, cell cycle sensor histidine kinase and response regulator CckA
VGMPTGKTEHGNETILLVEPDLETRDAAAAMLSQWGYRVLQANSAPEACKLYAEHGSRVKLLLTEAPMPIINGHELARMFSAKDPELRVLYLSEADYASLARRAAAGRGLEFLRRPFSMRTLAEKVRRALDSPTAQQSGAATAGAAPPEASP